ncbi:hypothetical protein AB0F46_19370 [Streptomyces sp. NPDC026665]|uniref:hypothetical protein n=1 Tax=Streptomyces sp. NPDC026665 TaxID=3154798 RepID=UPI00340FE7DB
MPHRYSPRLGQRPPKLRAPALCGTGLTPGHRVGVFVVILLVVTALVAGGHSLAGALGVVMAAGAAAARIGSWLGEQRPAVASAGGA